MPITAAQSDAMIAAIREVAAGTILPRFRNLGQGEVDTKSRFDDLVTVADTEAEQALTARFQAILPSDTVIGEEAVSSGAASLEAVGAGRCVVIDPIDGTWNFAHGVSLFGVIVAVIEDGETVWGCLYDPSHDDWVVAHRGGGTWFHRNGAKRRLQTQGESAPLDRMRGNLGEHYMPEPYRSGIACLVPQVSRNVLLGASVMEYRHLCLAASDFCLNRNLNVWDHAAGVLCLSEAGGYSALLDGTPYQPEMVTQGAEDRAFLLNARSRQVWDEMAQRVENALA